MLELSLTSFSVVVVVFPLGTYMSTKTVHVAKGFGSLQSSGLLSGGRLPPGPTPSLMMQSYQGNPSQSGSTQDKGGGVLPKLTFASALEEATQPSASKDAAAAVASEETAFAILATTAAAAAAFGVLTAWRAAKRRAAPITAAFILLAIWIGAFISREGTVVLGRTVPDPRRRIGRIDALRRLGLDPDRVGSGVKHGGYGAAGECVEGAAAAAAASRRLTVAPGATVLSDAVVVTQPDAGGTVGTNVGVQGFELGGCQTVLLLDAPAAVARLYFVKLGATGRHVVVDGLRCLHGGSPLFHCLGPLLSALGDAVIIVEPHPAGAVNAHVRVHALKLRRREAELVLDTPAAVARLDFVKLGAARRHVGGDWRGSRHRLSAACLAWTTTACARLPWFEGDGCGRMQCHAPGPRKYGGGRHDALHGSVWTLVS
ncbi:hypothetical protein GE09DRAFT_202670 [Coniochaeta sp. 2T2.1]|nr:hypothetical protein GE09DRAFT_202670 [Coniochaeta sp. 2T2.1]